MICERWRKIWRQYFRCQRNAVTGPPYTTAECTLPIPYLRRNAGHPSSKTEFTRGPRPQAWPNSDPWPPESTFCRSMLLLQQQQESGPPSSSCRIDEACFGDLIVRCSWSKLSTFIESERESNWNVESNSEVWIITFDVQYDADILPSCSLRSLLLKVWIE